VRKIEINIARINLLGALERFAQREIVSVILNHDDSIFSHFELTLLSL